MLPKMVLVHLSELEIGELIIYYEVVWACPQQWDPTYYYKNYINKEDCSCPFHSERLRW